MRILRVAQKVYPEVKGGGPYHVHAMSRDQAAMGHEVTVLTLDPDGNKPHTEERDGYTVIRYPVTVSALGNDISAGLASYLRSAENFDVIHAHSHLYFSTNLAALKRAAGGPPLAITNHGLYSQNAPKWVFDLYLRTVGRWTFNRADVVFCYTEEDESRLRDFGVTSPVKIVHNGIDTDRFSTDGRHSEEVIGDPSVLFVGRLVDGKLPGDALCAFSEIRERFPNSGLTFCGDGPLRGRLERQVHESGIKDAVCFLGQVPYDIMPAVYRAADVLVLPSRAEGLPRTVLEAMSSGTPVVVSDLEQVAPVVDGGGKTVPAGDISGFVSALVNVIEGDHESPRHTIEGSFDWDDTVRQTTESLKQE